MALIKCMECGKEISDRAEECVHCGCPIEVSIENINQSDLEENSNDSESLDSEQNIKPSDLLETPLSEEQKRLYDLYVTAMSTCANCGAQYKSGSKFCAKCGAPNGESKSPNNTSENTNVDVAKDNNPQPVVQHQKNNGGLMKLISVIITIILILAPFHNTLFETSYYVAKLPSISAASVKVDGYMHKSKSCCQKVANKFGAEVIRVKPNKSAGTNSYSQTVRYKDCFSYCPLCN